MSALGLVNLAERAPAEQREEYLTLIKRSLLKLNSFIEEMNNFFRNEKLALQREKIAIRTLITDEIHDLKNLYHADKIRIDLKVDEGSDFFSDILRIKTVMTNILTNAIKYADPGKIDPFIQVAVKVRAEFCEITVSDNGIGIEAEKLDKIFTLFYTTTNSITGSGLGLYITKETVEKLKGYITINSKKGEGTKIKVVIPGIGYGM